MRSKMPWCWKRLWTRASSLVIIVRMKFSSRNFSFHVALIFLHVRFSEPSTKTWLERTSSQTIRAGPMDAKLDEGVVALVKWESCSADECKRASWKKMKLELVWMWSWLWLILLLVSFLWKMKNKSAISGEWGNSLVSDDRKVFAFKPTNQFTSASFRLSTALLQLPLQIEAGRFSVCLALSTGPQAFPNPRLVSLHFQALGHQSARWALIASRLKRSLGIWPTTSLELWSLPRKSNSELCSRLSREN